MSDCCKNQFLYNGENNTELVNLSGKDCCKGLLKAVQTENFPPQSSVNFTINIKKSPGQGTFYILIGINPVCVPEV